MFWLERCADSESIPPRIDGKALFGTYALLFFKHYDQYRETVTYAGHAFAPLSTKIRELEPVVRKLVAIEPECQLMLWEEVRPSMIDLLDMDKTISEAELGIGDIVVFQRALSLPEAALLRLPLADQWYSFMSDPALEELVTIS